MIQLPSELWHIIIFFNRRHRWLQRLAQITPRFIPITAPDTSHFFAFQNSQIYYTSFRSVSYTISFTDRTPGIQEVEINQVCAVTIPNKTFFWALPQDNFLTNK